MCAASSSERLHDALDRLHAVWLTLGVPLGQHLADPLPPSDTTAVLADAGLAAPEELTGWFSWHDGHNYPDGTDRTLTLCGIGGFALMPMRGCLHELAVWREVFGDDDQDLTEEGWIDSWFPLLRAGDGSAVIAVVGQHAECQTGYSNAEIGFRPVTTSITALVERWAGRIERGEWTWDPRFHWASNPPGLITDVI